MSVPTMPSETTSIDTLAVQLNACTHAQRLAWAYQLNEAEQRTLFELAAGRALHIEQLVGRGSEVIAHQGRNGLPFFNRFEKRFARLDDEFVGYNYNEFGGILHFLIKRATGPGHYTSYNGPDGDGVWIDYRTIPRRRHPEFPPLIDNDHGIRALIFGNMVDVLRRVSNHVLIGNAYKNKSPARTFMSRLGSKLPTAPFVLVQPEKR